MRLFFQYLHTNLNRFIIGTVFLLGISVILLLLPTERKYRYEFQIGKPWLHENLYAPFDFAIYKTEEEIKNEKDSVKRSLLPFYELHTDVYEKQLNKFQAAYSSFLSSNIKTKKHISIDSIVAHDKVFLFGKSLLDKVYSKGIAEGAEFRNYTRINIVKGKFVEEADIEALYTISSAKVEFAKEINNIFAKTNDSSYFTLNKNVPLRGFLKTNIKYNKTYTNYQERKLLNSRSNSRGMIKEGDKIISRGDFVNDQNYRILYSLKREFETNGIVSSSLIYIYVGQTILVILSFLILLLLIYYANPEILSNTKSSLFIILIVMTFVAFTRLIIRFDIIDIYAIPFVIIPILVKTFYNQRVAFYTHLITMLLVAFMVPNSFEFIFIQIIVGVIAMVSIGEYYKRSFLFWTAVFAFFAYCIVYMGIALMQEGNISNVNWYRFVWFGWNSILLLSVYPLIFLIEKLFGFVSDLTLIELSDTNNVLLRELSEKAPGTFQHSLMVSNLAEYAVSKINGKRLLTKVGALYHDIGKAEGSAYFTENQNNNENPHDKLTPLESVKIIINHVTIGAKKAKKAKLPEQIIDFILTHHGTTKVKYFLYQYKQENLNADIDEDLFKYPFYRPNSKELAVMMIADSLEATARSMNNHSEESLSELVNTTIDRIIEDKQLDEVDITFKDLSILRKAFTEKLMSIYHPRIAYPKEITKKNN